jgi:hypothetical protein
VAQWEKLQASDFEKKRFTFDKHADLPTDQRPPLIAWPPRR